MTVYIPPMKPIPKGATYEQRKVMYEEYKQQLIKYNPIHFNKDDSQKTTWQVFKGLFT